MTANEQMLASHLRDLAELALITRPSSRPRRPRTRKRDPTRIPRPMNCFLAYRLEKQKEIAQQCPGANHRDISRVIAKWWREAPEHEKQHYRNIADKAKQSHAEKYPDYKYTPKRKRTTNVSGKASKKLGENTVLSTSRAPSAICSNVSFPPSGCAVSQPVPSQSGSACYKNRFQSTQYLSPYVPMENMARISASSPQPGLPSMLSYTYNPWLLNGSLPMNYALEPHMVTPVDHQGYRYDYAPLAVTPPTLDYRPSPSISSSLTTSECTPGFSISDEDVQWIDPMMPAGSPWLSPMACEELQCKYLDPSFALSVSSGCSLNH
ncbi:uncharacterized protein BYT42DRAFT_548314 [Radiomyces spectabilis]|uniref:uncharacterized protein n=1 Tax=Radiomyces spectabilis TaxID=64574 RepID=UPI00221F742C|nr:uncharacterized protein BYT42DRAFT_548314 [Radiomyces spectabilis]KAI8371446.1 hypothetical protein BYT42DRAFT_548314 [Radiomyces spectabilis]